MHVGTFLNHSQIGRFSPHKSFIECIKGTKSSKFGGVTCFHQHVTRFLIDSDPIFSFTSGATISIELATGFFMTDFLVIVLLFKHYGKKQFFQFFAHHSVSIIAFSLVLYHKGKDLLIICLFYNFLRCV